MKAEETTEESPLCWWKKNAFHYSLPQSIQDSTNVLMQSYYTSEPSESQCIWSHSQSNTCLLAYFLKTSEFSISGWKYKIARIRTIGRSVPIVLFIIYKALQLKGWRSVGHYIGPTTCLKMLAEKHVWKRCRKYKACYSCTIYTDWLFNDIKYVYDWRYLVEGRACIPWGLKPLT